MPGRGIMRAKQLRGGSLGQGTRFYYLGSSSFSKIAGAQGFGKTNPSIGSMRSLGVMKQNRKAGGNNVCSDTVYPSYNYTQVIKVNSTGVDQTLPLGTLIYLNGTTRLLGKIIAHNNILQLLDKEFPLPIGNINIPVTYVVRNAGFPGTFGRLLSAGPVVQTIDAKGTNCNCRGPKAFCGNCSGRNNPLGAVTGGSMFSSTTGFSLQTH